MKPCSGLAAFGKICISNTIKSIPVAIQETQKVFYTCKHAYYSLRKNCLAVAIKDQKTNNFAALISPQDFANFNLSNQVQKEQCSIPHH